MTAALAILRGHWQLICLVALIFTFWDTDIIQPLRVLTVFLHELSHAVATILTGGSVVDFSVSANESGHVYSRGGNRFIALSAGYLGSLLIGLALVLLAVRTTLDRWVLGALGAVLMAVTFLFIRTLYPFGFGLLTGAAFLVCAWFAPARVSDLVLRVVGLTSMIYVPFDIFADTIRWASLRSDARMLAEEFGGTTMMWGALWLVISLALIWIALRHGLGRDSNIRFGLPAKRP